MKSFIQVFSFGRLAACLAQAVGWSPVGRFLMLHGAEGPDSHLFNGVVGTVQSIADGVIVVKPGDHSDAPGSKVSLLRLTPRHKGWSPLSLMLSNIAVVAESLETHGGTGPVTIAIASIDRSRRLRR